MAKLSAVAFHGKSGEQYHFDVWNLNQAFKPLGAVYAITLRHKNSNDSYSHKVIYVGQTGDLASRFLDHHKEECFASRNANCICTHLDDDEDSRCAKEEDLINRYDPPCNG